MRLPLIASAMLVLSCPLPALAQAQPSAADRKAAFLAAGFSLQAGKWKNCDDPGTASYTAGQIEDFRDLNGDGRPEAIITEGSSFCFGMTGTGFSLVSKQSNGTWKLMTSDQGVPTILATKAPNGWPDIEVGGPGFCFPVIRWNGSGYKVARYQYEGKPCRPAR